MANSNYCGISYFILFCSIALHVFAEQTLADETYCGSPTADAEKICISIRLPWQPEPIYFCTDKDNVKYRKNCRYEGQCGFEKSNTNDLLIATPWDCCPVTSTPDYCTKEHLYDECLPQPFNRTCYITNNTIKSSSRHTLRSECCPNYFCEVDTKPENCNYKLLHPECMPPANKTNCIAFIDEHGCCNKYQCDEDEVKPGTCPYSSYPIGNPYGNNINTTMDLNLVSDEHIKIIPESSESTVELSNSMTEHSPTATEMSNSMTTESSSATVPMSQESSSHMRCGTGTPHDPHRHIQQQCVSDHTCPGELKCCPETYSMSNKSPVYGFCTQPAKIDRAM